MGIAEDQKLISVRKGAAKIDVSVKTIKRAINSGKLPGVRVGNLYKVTQEALSHFIKPVIPQPVIIDKPSINNSLEPKQLLSA